MLQDPCAHDVQRRLLPLKHLWQLCQPLRRGLLAEMARAIQEDLECVARAYTRDIRVSRPRRPGDLGRLLVEGVREVLVEQLVTHECDTELR